MMPLAELVEPSDRWRDSYRALVAEFVDRGENPVPFVLTFDSRDFDAMLTKLADCARGVGIPEGFVAHSTYWLVHEGAVVAVSNIRHALTPALRVEGGHIGYGVRPSARGGGFGTEILRQSLLRARALGIGEKLLTCSRRNVASASVIRRNGGVLASEDYVESRREVVQRWRIDPPA